MKIFRNTLKETNVTLFASSSNSPASSSTWQTKNKLSSRWFCFFLMSKQADDAWEPLRGLTTDVKWNEHEHNCTRRVSKELLAMINKMKKVKSPEIPTHSFSEHYATLCKLLYQSKNQHRVTKFFQHLEGVKRRMCSVYDLQLLFETISTFQKSNFMDKKQKTITCKSREYAKTLLEAFRHIQAYFTRLLELLVQTAMYGVCFYAYTGTYTYL